MTGKAKWIAFVLLASTMLVIPAHAGDKRTLKVGKGHSGAQADTSNNNLQTQQKIDQRGRVMTNSANILHKQNESTKKIFDNIR